MNQKCQLTKEYNARKSQGTNLPALSDEVLRNLDLTALPRFLTVAEFSELRRVSRATTYRLIAAGEVPVRRTGRRLAIPRSALAFDAGPT
jgi:excisionase family DNA binding protein